MDGAIVMEFDLPQQQPQSVTQFTLHVDGMLHTALTLVPGQPRRHRFVVSSASVVRADAEERDVQGELLCCYRTERLLFPLPVQGPEHCNATNQLPPVPLLANIVGKLFTIDAFLPLR